jgi:hypothetical protein
MGAAPGGSLHVWNGAQGHVGTRARKGKKAAGVETDWMDNPE